MANQARFVFALAVAFVHAEAALATEVGLWEPRGMRTMIPSS